MNKKLNIRTLAPRARGARAIPFPGRACSNRSRRGTALVEFAFVSILLFTVVFGIIEFSWLGYTRAALANGVAKAARSGAAGKTVAAMRDGVREKSGLNVPDACIAIDYNTSDSGSGEWCPVTDDPRSGDPPLANGVPEGKPVRVRVAAWPYPMITGSLFAWLVMPDGHGITLSASSQVRRE
jgi:Flp pilus assembly protein TadG